MKLFKSFSPDVITMLQNGAVGVMPTDTVYGIVALFSHQEAVKRLYKIKNRDPQKPVGTILINDPLQIEQLVPSESILRAEVYWPGPVSVILPVSAELYYAHRGHDSLPFRVPDQANLRTLLASTGPLATSSANMQGEAGATTMQEALRVFRENVDFYVDGGDLSHKKPSKIIRIMEDGEVEEIRA